MVAWANADALRRTARDGAGDVLEPLARRAVGEGRDERQPPRRRAARASTATATRCSLEVVPAGPACHTGAGQLLRRRRRRRRWPAARDDRGARATPTRGVLHRPPPARPARARRRARSARRRSRCCSRSRRRDALVGRGRRPLVPLACCCSRATASTRWRRCACSPPAHAEPVLRERRRNGVEQRALARVVLAARRRTRGRAAATAPTAARSGASAAAPSRSDRRPWRSSSSTG